MLLVQMGGRPGVGKSAVARGIAREFDAVIFDNDVVKSSLLDSGVSWELASSTAWDLVFALADSALAQGLNAILDNPCHYPTIPERGLAIAAARQAEYAMVECVCADDAEVARRMAERPRLRSQMTGPGEWAPDATGPSSAVRTGQHDWVIYRPDRNWIELDVSRPLDVVVADAVESLRAVLSWAD